MRLRLATPLLITILIKCLKMTCSLAIVKLQSLIIMVGVQHGCVTLDSNFKETDFTYVVLLTRIAVEV